MRIKSFLTALLLLPLSAVAQEKISSPKPYLNIVVDQLRTDFLYEFSELYGEGGFKRLLAEVYIRTGIMPLRMWIGLRRWLRWLRVPILM